jgi:hypothetical protein
MTNFNELIDKMRDWNDGNGLGVKAWVGCEGIRILEGNQIRTLLMKIVLVVILILTSISAGIASDKSRLDVSNVQTTTEGGCLCTKIQIKYSLKDMPIEGELDYKYYGGLVSKIFYKQGRGVIADQNNTSIGFNFKPCTEFNQILFVSISDDNNITFITNMTSRIKNAICKHRDEKIDETALYLSSLKNGVAKVYYLEYNEDPRLFIMKINTEGEVSFVSEKKFIVP